MNIYPNLILEALQHVRYPGTGKDIVTSGMVQDNIRIEGKKVSFSLIFEKPTIRLPNRWSKPLNKLSLLT